MAESEFEWEGSVEVPHWENVTSTNKSWETEIRASFHLYAYPGERDLLWQRICQLTREDKLGYMSSISPDVMNGGDWEDAFTISIHTDHHKREEVKAVLVAEGLHPRIFNYNLIAKLRNNPKLAKVLDECEMYTQELLQ